MLPIPATAPKRRTSIRRNLVHPRRQGLSDVLLSQARITNLGFLLLALIALISLSYNIDHWRNSTSRGAHQSILSTFARPKQSSTLNHLIIVPGHAIWNGASADSRLNEDMWTLEPYQKKGGRVEAFYQHIARAVNLSLRDERSLVVFSGGQTRASTTTTEGESYLRLALQANLLPSSENIRATTENYALDSYQNLLFSIARFHEYTGRYPQEITVVGYAMKQKRFTDIHRVAIRWPEHQFHYIGIDSDHEESDNAQAGERMYGYLPYAQDVYGCHSELLLKRQLRNRHIRFHPYHSSSPELSALMEWCPRDGDSLYHGLLPWTGMYQNT